jgi:hypothetical protein
MGGVESGAAFAGRQPALTPHKTSTRSGGRVRAEVRRLDEAAATTSVATVAGAADAVAIPSRGQRAVVARTIEANADGGGGGGRERGVAGRAEAQGYPSLSSSVYVPAVPPLTAEGPHSTQGLCVMDGVPIAIRKERPHSALRSARKPAGVR